MPSKEQWQQSIVISSIMTLGDCLFITPKIAKSTCKIDRVNTEYQICDLKFGSWTYNGLLLDVEADEADLNYFTLNDDWEILSMYSYG